MSALSRLTDFTAEELQAELASRAAVPKLPADLKEMMDRCYSEEFWRPEYLYFAVNEVDDDDGDFSVDGKNYVFLARWHWHIKDIEEAENGYFRFYCLPDNMEVEESDGGYWMLSGGNEDDLIAAGFEQKQDILELFK